MTIGEINDSLYDLKDRARDNYKIKIIKAEEYLDGYLKACEDFRNKIRDINNEEAKKN